MGRKITIILLCCLIVVMALMVTNCTSTNITTEPTSKTTEQVTTTAEPTQAQLPAPGREAPDLELMNLEGQAVKLRDYRGSPVMLNFWASRCGPCRYEMPSFQEIYEDVEWQTAGLVILAVNVGESPSTAEGFMEANSLTFPVLLDEEEEVAIRYNIRAIPTTFFIDENGIIRYIDVGAFRSKLDIEQRLNVLIEDGS